MWPKAMYTDETNVVDDDKANNDANGNAAKPWKMSWPLAKSAKESQQAGI